MVLIEYRIRRMEVGENSKDVTILSPSRPRKEKDGEVWRSLKGRRLGEGVWQEGGGDNVREILEVRGLKDWGNTWGILAEGKVSGGELERTVSLKI